MLRKTGAGDGNEASFTACRRASLVRRACSLAFVAGSFRGADTSPCDTVERSDGAVALVLAEGSVEFVDCIGFCTVDGAGGTKARMFGRLGALTHGTGATDKAAAGAAAVAGTRPGPVDFAVDGAAGSGAV